METSRERRPAVFTMVGLILTIVMVVLLGALFLPALAKARVRSSRSSCANNLKQTGLAFVTWGLDNHGRFPMHVSVTDGGTMELAASGKVYPHFQVMSNELSTPKILLCPSDANRMWATNFEAALKDENLSYFVGLDAVERDGSSLLSGDRNLTTQPMPRGNVLSLVSNTSLGWSKEIHSGKGNLLFADGSVVQFMNSPALKDVRGPAEGTNRLAIP